MRRIVFFDMEGTLLKKAYHLDDGLVAPSAWTLLAEKLGEACLAAENETKQAWLSGVYPTYMDWMKATIEIHREFGLTEQLFNTVIDSVDMMPGAEQLVQIIKDQGAITAIISGGFKALADRVQTKLKIDHAFAGCEYFFSSKTGLINHFNLMPADETGKVEFMNLLCREYKVDPQHCVFIGDGKNDVHLARAVGLSIAFNAQPELRNVSSHSIEQHEGHEDLTAAAKIILGHFSYQTRM